MASVAENQEFSDHMLDRYPLDEAIEWIQKNLEPEDVFGETVLAEWAEGSGFTKEAP